MPLARNPLERAIAEASRIVVVVAHPDDEVLGCGGLLPALRDVAVVHVSNGAPRMGNDGVRHGFSSPAAYAAARRREAETALALAGVPAARLASLGFSDQDVSHHLVAAVRDIGPHLDGAAVVLTHAFEGGHSDHDAVAFAVHAACRLRSVGPGPAIVEMPFYFGGADGWVRQELLPHRDAGPTVSRVLTAAERELKTRMIEAHATQADTLRSFTFTVENFRSAPAYDFTQPPHPGPLLYERYGWNLTWRLWCELVEAAQTALGVSGAL